MTRILGALLGVLIGTGTAHAQDTSCPAVTKLTSSLSTALTNAELEQAATLASQAKTAILCQTQPLQTMLAAQLFRLSGAAAYFNGNMAGATEAFTLAASISPGEDLETVYGLPAGSFYAGIRDKLVAKGGASIILKGSGEAWVDGRVLRKGIPRDLTVGTHIVQTRAQGGTISATEITLAAGAEHVLGGGEAPPDPKPIVSQKPVDKPVTARKGSPRNMLLLGGGGALVATGAAMLALAAKSHGDFDDETDPSKLAGLQGSTNTMATLGLVSGAAGLGMVGAGALLSTSGLGLVVQGRW